MDKSQFDQLTRRLASRRSALGLLGGLAALGVEQGMAKRRRRVKSSSGKPQKCVPNKACAKWCSTTFGADTPTARLCTSDANKCKGPCWTCGAGCGETCGKTICNGACVTLGTSANCSGCGDACTGDTTCKDGACTSAPLVCSGGAVPCNGACVTLGTDANCSGCGDACADGLTCQGGTCQSITPHVCSGKNSPNPCFERDAARCGATGTCKCGTDIAGNLTCYENAYCLGPSEPDCTSNAQCEAIFGQGSVCFSGADCCAKNGCTSPCPTPSA
jgi:hypothetical protein